jgi:WD40 repeat protein
VDGSRCRLAVPGLLGDPFTAFDLDEVAGVLATGTAAGAVALWRLDHVDDILLGRDEDGDEASSGDGKRATQQSGAEIVCRVLCSSSDEGVKHLFFSDDEQLFAVIGDVHVKIWGSYHDATCQLRRFDRPHEYKTCKESYTLRHGNKLLLLTVGTNQGLKLDLDTMQQQPFKLDIPHYCTPTFYDGRHLMLLALTPSGLRLVQLYDMDTQRLERSLLFDKADRFYWGFQLLPSSTVAPSGAANEGAPVAAAAAAAGALPQQAVAPFAAAASESKENGSGAPSSSSLLQQHLAYVCCHSKVNLVPVACLPAPLTLDQAEKNLQWEGRGAFKSNATLLPPQSSSAVVPPSSSSSSSSSSADAAASATVAALPSRQLKIVASRPGAARLVSFVFDGPSRTLLTLSSDAKIKLFALDAEAARTLGVPEEELVAARRSERSGQPTGGVLVRKYRHVGGTFRLGYPYILKRISKRIVAYSADEGIFILRL